MAGKRGYRPGEGADSLKKLTREALLASTALRAAATAGADRAAKALERSGSAAAKNLDRFARNGEGLAKGAEALASAAAGLHGLKADLASVRKVGVRATSQMAAGALTAKVAPNLPKAGLGLGLGF